MRACVSGGLKNALHKVGAQIAISEQLSEPSTNSAKKEMSDGRVGAVAAGTAVDTDKVQWMHTWLPRGNDALCAAVDTLLRQWKETGMMARNTIEPSFALTLAWDVNALREMVLLDAQCRALWEDGDPNRPLKPNDALSHAVRAAVNKVFEVAQVPAKALSSRRERLGHLQSHASTGRTATTCL